MKEKEYNKDMLAENAFNARTLRRMGIRFETRKIADEFSNFIQEELNLRIGKKISQGKTDEELGPLVNMTDQREIIEWLEHHAPEYREIVAEETEAMKNEIFQNRYKIPGALIMKQSRHKGLHSEHRWREDRKRIQFCGLGSLRKPLFFFKPKKIHWKIAQLYNLLLMWLFIPVFVAGMLVCKTGPYQIAVWSKPDFIFGLLFGTVLGMVFHELSHMCAALSYKGRSLTEIEIGIGTNLFLPICYVGVELSHKSKFKSIQIFAAGAEMNILLAGLFYLFSGLACPLVLRTAGLVNFCTGIINLFLPIKGTDGFFILSRLFNKDNLLEEACKYILKRRKKKSKCQGIKDVLKILGAYSLVGIQVLLIVGLIGIEVYGIWNIIRF